MTENATNPFNVTKSVDLSDQEINDYWVDITDGRGFIDMVKPTSPMPMIILGGKGSGKTHLMRYFSYPLQRIRHKAPVSEAIRTDGYLGIYMRCSGLNAARFQHKQQSADVWNAVFAYHLEVWLAQLLVDTLCQAFEGTDSLKTSEPEIASSITQLFDTVPDGHCHTLRDIRRHLQCLQQEIDIAVNNCGLTQHLDLRIHVTPGRLVFGIPKVLARTIEPLGNTVFLYLLDEFENLSASQQKHVNTLLREKEMPCSFKVGARLYGVKTYSTYSADEDIKEGSEYEMLRLDERLRNNPNYKGFAKRLVLRRLCEHGYPFSDNSDPSLLRTYFEELGNDEYATEETAFVSEKYAARDRPYFLALRTNLERGIRVRHAPALGNLDDISMVVDCLRRPEYPLLEKTNCLLLYKAWSGAENLKLAAEAIQAECSAYIQDHSSAPRYAETLMHFRADLLAQLRRDCDQKQKYLGLDTFIELSSGLPRNLLIVLKNVFDWAVFAGEAPFGDRPISVNAQVKGVQEAADWFFRDARMSGSEGRIVQEGVNRLATLFRSIRYSDKPSECSLLAFSYDTSGVSENAYRVIEEAAQWSLLIEVGGQRDRNSDRIDRKIQLNKMLAPRWDLPIGRRGALALSGEEVNALFDPALGHLCDQVLKARVERMTAPLFGRKPDGPEGALLPGFDHA